MKDSELKVYKGDNPNSLYAWFFDDISPTQNGRIFLKDKYENYEWEQGKSNQNIKEFSSKGSGNGKGFSFYFARYAYNDLSLLRNTSLSTSGHSGLLASIYTDFLNKYAESSKLPSKLNSKKRILLVIDDEQNDSKITIVSAYYTVKKELLEMYTDNIAEKLIMDNEQQTGQFRESTDTIRKKIKKAIMNKIKASVIEGTNEFEQLVKLYS